MQTIYLDISNKGIIPTIYAKQGDVGREFLVILTDAGVPYSPPGGSVFSVWYDGASGEGNYTDIGSSPAIIVNANTVKVELISQMLQNEGEGKLCLALNKANGDQISSWNISYICESVPGHKSEEAKAFFTAFSNAVQNLPYPDVSLSTPGKAADAGATGEALAGKAPAGYGLGEHIYWHSADGVLDFFDEQLATMPDGTKKFIEFAGDYQTTQGALFVGELCKRDNNYAYVIGYTYSDAMGLYRAKYGGVWNPWEFINPPMSEGVEYRTTERYNGKPVYAKLVSYYASATIGNTTAITDIEIPHQISNYGALVRCEAKVSSSPLPVFYSGTAITCVKQVDLANVVLRIINDTWHNGTFEFCIYYTKE